MFGWSVIVVFDCLIVVCPLIGWLVGGWLIYGVDVGLMVVLIVSCRWLIYCVAFSVVYWLVCWLLFFLSIGWVVGWFVVWLVACRVLVFILAGVGGWMFVGCAISVLVD